MHLPSIAVFGGLGLAFGAFAVIGKGHNLTWFLGGLIPGVLAMQYNSARQPDMLLQNAYRYILAKRTATIEFQQQALAFETGVPNTDGFKQLRKAMVDNGSTLYELEADIVDKIDAGNL